MFSVFNAAVPTPMYNYQPVIPTPKVAPGCSQEIQTALPTLIFLYNIPRYLDDDDILELLASCGSVKSWKRVAGHDGLPTDFGFCVFETALGVIRALRSIPFTPGDELLIGVRHNMAISIDIATKNHLRHQVELLVTEKDFEVVQKFKYLFEPFRNIQLDEFVASLEQVVPPIISPMQALISMYDDETEEQSIQKLLKIKTEQVRVYEDRVKRFERLEIQRIKKYHLDEEGESMATKLSLFDDDYESRVCNDDFYRDNQRWCLSRQRDRDRESENDRRDIQVERDEMIARERKSEREAREREEKIEAEMIEAQEAYDQMQLQRDNDTRVEREEQARIDRMKLDVDIIPVQEEIKVTKILTQLERGEAIRNLVALIPTEKDDVFSYTVKWEHIDKVQHSNQSIIEKKLRPFLVKKFKEVVVEESSDLVDYIILSISHHQHIQSVYDELFKVLEDEALVFVIVFWRLVIYETEARASGLS